MPGKFLLSPSETKLAEALEDEAMTSALPEEKGADILLYSNSGLVGFQRKQVPHDFLDSVTGGRFARLLPLLTKNCTFHRLINEGKFTYWPDQTVHLGMLKGGKRIPSTFTRNGIHGILNDIEFVWDVRIRVTEDLEDTVRYLRSVRKFMEAKKHVGLHTRPKVRGAWYVPSAIETQLWLLQGFSGIGPSTADNIIGYFGGIPLKWSCTVEELMSIKGVTEEKARDLMKVLEVESPHIESSSRQKPAKVAVEELRDLICLRRQLGR